MYIYITHYMYRSVFDVLCPKASRGDLSLSCGLSLCALRWGHVWLRRGQVENLVQGANLWSEIGVFHISELSFQDWFLSKLWILKVHIAWVLVSHFCEATSWLNTFVDCTRMQMTLFQWLGGGQDDNKNTQIDTGQRPNNLIHSMKESSFLKAMGTVRTWLCVDIQKQRQFWWNHLNMFIWSVYFFVCIHTWI